MKLATDKRKRRSRGACARHNYPCTCAMGHLYRFVEPALLLILKEKGSSYGYDLSRRITECSFTDAEIDRAALYRTLGRLQKNGYVRSKWSVDGPGPARRVYVLTKAGETHLREWAQVLSKVAVCMGRFVKRATAQ